MTRSTYLTVSLCIAVLCMPFWGCSDSDTPVSPGIQPEIINSVDNFQFQVSAMQNYTGILEYVWANTGTRADVDQSCAVSAGTAAIEILDDPGSPVYAQDLSQDGSYSTSLGTAGSWRIRVILHNASGTLNFRVDGRPVG